MTKKSDSVYESCRRLLNFVHELHQRGYEQLRIQPATSPSGMHWRCAFYPRKNFVSATEIDESLHSGRPMLYSSAEQGRFFEWDDADEKSPAELADRFIECFPNLVRDSFGPDPAYVAWFEKAVQMAQQDAFPIFFADYPTPTNRVATIGNRSNPKRTMPLPPFSS